MSDLIKIATVQFSDEEVQAVRAKDLYSFLGFRKGNYARWIEKVIKWQWIEWVDYIPSVLFMDASSDFVLSLDFAKSVAMMTKTNKGHEVRAYFIEVEKAYKKVIAVVKPKTTLEMLKEAVAMLEEKDEEILRLETSNRQKDNTNARIYDMKAKDTKTGLDVLKDDAGRSINNLVMLLYGDLAPEELTKGEKFAWVHKHAHAEYKRATGITYLGAKQTDLKHKRAYLDWLLSL